MMQAEGGRRKAEGGRRKAEGGRRKLGDLTISTFRIQIFDVVLRILSLKHLQQNPMNGTSYIPPPIGILPFGH